MTEILLKSMWSPKLCISPWYPLLAWHFSASSVHDILQLIWHFSASSVHDILQLIWHFSAFSGYLCSVKCSSIWVTSWQNLLMPYANNKNADQSAHLQCICYLLPRKYAIAKPNISRLGNFYSWEGQFESYLVAQLQWQVFSWCVSFYYRDQTGSIVPHFLTGRSLTGKTVNHFTSDPHQFLINHHFHWWISWKNYMLH